MTIVPRLPILLASCAAFFVPACHSAFAAETPKTLSPSIDIEVEDKGPAGAPHTARFNVSLVNGSGDLNASDGDAQYGISAHSISGSEPRLAAVKLKRTDRSPSAEIYVAAAIPAAPGERIVVARIDRGDGRTTTVLARAH
jgi:hypothetical protein